MEQTGKAYGFFYCNASKKNIKALLPKIRTAAKTPSKLELSLTEGVDNLTVDAELTVLAKEAKQEGMNYVLEATYHGATHKNTADELSAVLNQAYQSPLYKKGEHFRGGIVYQEKGKYVLKE